MSEFTGIVLFIFLMVVVYLLIFGIVVFIARKKERAIQEARHRARETDFKDSKDTKEFHMDIFDEQIEDALMEFIRRKK